MSAAESALHFSLEAVLVIADIIRSGDEDSELRTISALAVVPHTITALLFPLIAIAQPFPLSSIA